MEHAPAGAVARNAVHLTTAKAGDILAVGGDLPPDRTLLFREPRPPMLTGEIRNQIDHIWNAFWSGGVSNPLSVIEQITYLLFIKRLDDLQTLEENKAETLGLPMERRIFPAGVAERGRALADMRWSRFKNFEPREMMEVAADHVVVARDNVLPRRLEAVDEGQGRGIGEAG